MDTIATCDLEYVLSRVKHELQITDSSSDEFLLQHIIIGLEEINIFHIDLTGTTTVNLTVNDARIVDLPLDYVDYYKIGVVFGNKVSELTYNPKLATPTEESCGEQENEYPQEKSHYGATMGKGFDFKIDLKQRRIILGGNVPSNKIYMEYYTSGINANTVIPKEAVSTIVAYTIWKKDLRDTNVPFNMKELSAEIYVKSLRRLNEFRNRLTIEQFIDAVYGNNYRG